MKKLKLNSVGEMLTRSQMKNVSGGLQAPGGGGGGTGGLGNCNDECASDAHCPSGTVCRAILCLNTTTTICTKA